MITMTDRRIYRKDQISELPRNIIEGILERMSIRDAARTSILSTKWRSIWTTISQLKLGNQFFKDTLKVKPIVKHELILIVGFFSFRGMLTRLELVNAIFKAPRESSGFHNLISLHFKKIAFAHNILRTLFSMSPLLQRLTIKHCTGIGNLNIQAPKLKRLRVQLNSEIQSICFMNTQNLSYVAIIFGLTMGSPKSVKTPNVVRFLGDFPRIAELNLDGFFIKRGVPHKLPTTANLLKLPQLDETSDLGKNVESRNLTCIIMERNDEELVLNRLEAPNCMD
ncbi:unnamed protein product [Camellia sinensis]